MAERTIYIVSKNDVTVMRDYVNQRVNSKIIDDAKNGDAFSWENPHDLTLTFSGDRTALTFEDADGVLSDDPFANERLQDQRLTEQVKIDGKTYKPTDETVRWSGKGQVNVENEYEVTLFDDAGNEYRMVGVSITEGYSTSVVGVTFDGPFPPPGTSLHYIQGVSTYNGTGQTLAIPSDPVCFLAGTLIETPDGARAIETLKAGMRVLTLENGTQTIRWTGRNVVCGLGRLAPICIRAGALDNARDLYVSPNHRILLRSSFAELNFGQGEVLVPAKALVNGVSVLRVPMRRADYLHLMLDTHDLVFSEGIASESLFAGHVAAHALGHDAMAELDEIFPDLRHLSQVTSHMGLTARETQYLMHQACPDAVQAVRLGAGVTPR
ncbi:Hint domain-containing protein [Pseudosulfitobacter koreensis]|uniref:Hint domain-containing protein n=1 Tax=Pseudosulfitobacter koreensis TaxID=2968472 RepID=A0ABT1Z0K1_9RHOB|nr:Hint domain-containing protein [Pseudosulfitobacter koreense]MCR8826645.1 Hint domain-containing protein [Pseudosulfitobacter koreense]